MRTLYGIDQKNMLNSNWTVKYGILHTYYQVDAYEIGGDSSHYTQSEEFPFDFFSSPETLIVKEEEIYINQDFYTLAAYTEALFQGRSWGAYLGYRHLYDEYVRSHMGGPRAGVKKHIGVHTFKYAAGVHTQSPYLSLMGAKYESGSYRMPKSLQNTLGWEARLKPGILFSLEFYDKQSWHLPRIVNGAAHDTGRIFSRGVDAYIKKNLEKRFWTGLSYTFNWNREKREGVWKKYAYSIPHSASFIFGYDLNRQFSASTRYSVGSGMPYTSRREVDPIRFGEKAESYSRFDVRCDYRKNFQRFSLTLFFEITNLFNRKNQFAGDEYELWDGWTIFPLGGIYLSF